MTKPGFDQIILWPRVHDQNQTRQSTYNMTKTKNDLHAGHEVMFNFNIPILRSLWKTYYGL